MFGSIRHVFTSRWKALWWAIGVCLTAYCTVPSPDPAPGSKEARAAAHHVNPWAKDRHDAAPAAQPESMSFKQIMEEAEKARKGGGDGHVNPWAKKPDPQQS